MKLDEPLSRRELGRCFAVLGMIVGSWLVLGLAAIGALYVFGALP